MQRFIFSTIIFVGLILASHASDASQSVLLSKEHNAATVTVHLASTATIALKGNPTTGYSWFLEGIGGNAVTSTCGMTYAANANRKNLIGGGGIFSCVLTAVHPGTSTVTCAYYRPWEKDKKEITYSVTLVVPPTKKTTDSPKADGAKPYVPNELLVGFKKGSTAAERKAAIAAISGAAIKKEMFSGSIVLITLPETISVPDAIKKLQAVTTVKYAEPNAIIRLDSK